LIERVSERIARLARNGQMLRMIRNFHDRSHYVRCLSLVHCANVSIHLEQIVGLLDLIRAGQIESARATLHAKMTYQIAHLPEIIRHARARWTEAAANNAENILQLQQLTPTNGRAEVVGTGKKSFRQL
jgi:hypothetical protein